MNEDEVLPTEEQPALSEATTGNLNNESITINVDGNAPVEDAGSVNLQSVEDETPDSPVVEEARNATEEITILPYSECEELVKQAKIDFYNKGINTFYASQNTFGSLHIHRFISYDGSIEGVRATVFVDEGVEDGKLITKE